MADSKEPKIVNFYSIKGGTGRSIALANVAYQLAQRGKRVMCVDFDLHAPSLYILFRDFVPQDAQKGSSIVELLLNPSDLWFSPLEVSTGKNTIYLVPIYGLNREVLDNLSSTDILDLKNIKAVADRLIHFSIQRAIDYLLIDSKSGVSNEAVAVLMGFIQLQQQRLKNRRKIFLMSRLDYQSLKSTQEALSILYKELNADYEDFPIEAIFTNTPMGTKSVELISGKFNVSDKAYEKIESFVKNIKHIEENIMPIAVVPYNEDFSIEPEIITDENVYPELFNAYKVITDYLTAAES